jgi:hypothetical protein
MEPAGKSHPQRKGVRQRNKPLVNQHSEKPNSKAGWLVGYRADQNLRTSHTPLKEEMTKQLQLKDRKKNL